MAFYRLLCFTVILLAPVTLLAQKQKVKISRESITIEQVFSEIEKQTGMTVAYSNSKIDPSMKVSFFWRSGRLERVLSRALKASGMTFVIKGSHVIVVPPSRLEEIRNVQYKSSGKESEEPEDLEIPEDTVIVVKVPHVTIGMNTIKIMGHSITKLKINEGDIRLADKKENVTNVRPRSRWQFLQKKSVKNKLTLSCYSNP